MRGGCFVLTSVPGHLDCFRLMPGTSSRGCARRLAVFLTKSEGTQTKDIIGMGWEFKPLGAIPFSFFFLISAGLRIGAQ